MSSRIVAALASALVSAVLVATVTATPAAAAAGDGERPCTAVEGVFARGSGQAISEAEATRFKVELERQVPGASFYELNTDPSLVFHYRAVPVVGSWDAFVNLMGAFISQGEMNNYGQSVNEGSLELYEYLVKREVFCPNTRFVLGGYSQGAQVIGEGLNERFDSNTLSRVVFSALFGDPKLSLPEGKTGHPHVGSPPPNACRRGEYSPWRRVVDSCNVVAGTLGARSPYLPTAAIYKTGSWCNEHDLICGSSSNPFDNGGHEEYATDPRFIDEAMREAAARVAAYQAGQSPQSFTDLVRTGAANSAQPSNFDPASSVSATVQGTTTDLQWRSSTDPGLGWAVYANGYLLGLAHPWERTASLPGGQFGAPVSYSVAPVSSASEIGWPTYTPSSNLEAYQSDPFYDGAGPDWLDSSAAFTNPPVSPLVLDLDGDGLDIILLKDSTAHFDLNENGLAEKTAWIGPDDGFLARDLNTNGKIDNLSELFGGATSDGFAKLAPLDTNADGRITSADSAFSQLKLWRDADGDGATDAGELQTLASAGVTEISLAATKIDQWIDSNWISHRSTFTKASGQSGNIDDIWFANDQVDTITPDASESEPSTDLPDLKGYGNLPTLSIAMSTSPALKTALQSIVLDSSTSTASVTHAALEEFILQWAGVATVPAGSRGQYVDARHLAFLEAIHGHGFVPASGGSQPGPDAGAALESYFNRAMSSYIGKVASQLPDSVYSLTGDAALADDHPLSALALFRYARDEDRLVPQLSDEITAIANELISTGESSPNLSGTIDALRLFNEVPLGSDRSSWLVRILQDFGVAGDVAQRFANIAGLPLDHALVGTEGDDTLSSTPAYELIDGRGGNDSITAGSGDTAFGGDGADTITTSRGPTTVYGGAGSDTITADRIWGVADQITGGPGNDVIEGGTGDDVFHWSRGDGNDTITDTATTYGSSGGTDKLRLHGVKSTEVSILTHASGPDISVSIPDSTAGAGDGGLIVLKDSFEPALKGIESIAFDDGTVWNTATIRGMSLIGTEGADTITGSSLADTIDGRGGNDTLAADNGDTVYGGDGADIINSSGAATTLYGGAGDDTIKGSGIFSGADQITGGPGSDVIDGGSGNDVFHWSRGDGNDTISDTASGTYNGGTDQLRLHGLVPGDVTILTHSSGPDISVSIPESAAGAADGGTILLKDSFEPALKGVESIAFDDGTVWNTATIRGKSLIGTEGADTITGSSLADTIDGRGGNDTLAADNGDTVYGGDGADTINISGSTTVYGGAGNDTVKGDMIWGRADQITGGPGNDAIEGGTGDDVFHWSRGDGNDTISDTATSYGSSGGNDQLRLHGLVPGDVSILTHVSGPDISVSIPDSAPGTSDGGAILLKDSFEPALKGIESIAFDDGTVWNSATIRGKSLIGTEGADTITGSSLADTIDGRGGNDTLTAGAGDTVYGGDGADIINSSGATTTLYGGAGNDTIKGDTIWGGADQITGGPGNDVIDGGAGNDVFHWSRGDGNDTISDTAAGSSSGGTDQLRLHGLAPGDVSILTHASGPDISVSIPDSTAGAGDGGLIVLKDSFEPALKGIESIAFDDGTIWNSATIRGKSLVGTDGNDTIVGSTLPDIIDGRGGNDTLDASANDTVYGGDGADQITASRGPTTIEGGAGNDTIRGDGIFSGADQITGGPGSDVIDGGSGNDVFHWSRGDGNDTISDTASGTYNGGTDQLRLHGLVPGDVTILTHSSGPDISVSIPESAAGAADGGTILLKDSFEPALKGIESIAFDDGTVWDSAMIRGKSLVGTDGSDTILGSTLPDIIDGRGGNDTLDGAGGADTFLWRRGDGSDTFNDSRAVTSETDTLSLIGVQPESVTTVYSGSGSNVTLVVSADSTAGPGGSLTLTGVLSPSTTPGVGIDRVVFDNGTIWDRAKLYALAHPN